MFPSFDFLYKEIMREVSAKSIDIDGFHRFCSEFAHTLVKNNRVTKSNIDFFIEKCYRFGIMAPPSDRFSSLGMDIVLQQRIFVPNYVLTNWAEEGYNIRQRAFRTGLYLTNDSSAPGIDQWNTVLARSDMLPDLFNIEDINLPVILERIVQMAEEAQDEHMTLPEYIAFLIGYKCQREASFQCDLANKLSSIIVQFALESGMQVPDELTPGLYSRQYYINRISNARLLDSLREETFLNTLLQHIRKSQRPTNRADILCQHLWRISTDCSHRLSFPCDAYSLTILWSVFLYSIQNILAPNNAVNDVFSTFIPSACNLFDIAPNSPKLSTIQQLQNGTYRNLIQDANSVVEVSGILNILRSIKSVITPESTDAKLWEAKEFAVLMADLTANAVELYPI